MLNPWVYPKRSKPRRWRYAGMLLLLAIVMGLGLRYWLQARNLTASPGAVNTIQALSKTKRLEPLTRLTILVLKSEKKMEVWGERAGKWKQLREYPVLSASGGAGPKLREGDRQVPEGIYRLSALVPDTKFHLALKLDYPNAFDKKMAERDGRTKLGGDICLHGKESAFGSIAIGDSAIEDLYALVEQVGVKNVKIILAPNDLRRHIPVRSPYIKVAWLNELYATLSRELAPFE